MTVTEDDRALARSIEAMGWHQKFNRRLLAEFQKKVRIDLDVLYEIHDGMPCEVCGISYPD